MSSFKLKILVSKFLVEFLINEVKNIKNIKEINFKNNKMIINETVKTPGEKVEKQ